MTTAVNYNSLAKQVKQELTDEVRKALTAFAETTRGARIVKEVRTYNAFTTGVRVQLDGESGPRYFEVLVKERY